MKAKNVKAVVSALLAVSMLLAVGGCAEKTKAVVIGPMEAEESVGISFDIIGGQDVMPIGGFYAPNNAKYSYDGQNAPQLVTEEIVKLISESGVNVILANNLTWTVQKQELQNLLDWGEKYKVGTFVKDGKLKGNSIETVNELISQYINHPACCGIYLVDEPGGTTYFATGGNGGVISDWAEVGTMLTEECELFYYGNLIKVTSLSQKNAYEQYLQEYIEEMKPKMLSYDFYPFDEDTRNDRQRYFWNMAIIREYAQKYEIPFWTFIQAGIIVNNAERSIEMTEGEMDWSVNCSLVFGAQGIEYFPLIQPTDFADFTSADGQTTIFDFESRGLIGAWGNLNRTYYYAQDINKHIAEIDDVLMNAVNKGVIASGKQAIGECSDARDAMIEGTSWRELKNVQGDALVGCFNYQGKTALYVVNYDTQYAQDIKLDFYDTYKIRVSHLAETEYFETNHLVLNMEAGDGALIVFE